MTLKKKPFENIVGKGEIAGNQHFIFSPQCFLPIPKRISDFKSDLLCYLQMLSIWTSIKNLSFGEGLMCLCVTSYQADHYQTTNFRFFQTERVRRRQFQIGRKWKKVIQTGRKHCGKTPWEKEKLLITSNFSFSHGVFKRLVTQGCQKVSLCGLTHYHTMPHFDTLKIYSCGKHHEKRRNACNK